MSGGLSNPDHAILRRSGQALVIGLLCFFGYSPKDGLSAKEPPTHSAVIRAAIPSAPHEQWALDLWGGSMWSFGSRATPLDYTLLSALPSVRTPSHLRWSLGDGDLVVRARFGLLLQPIIEGPESYFLGVIGGPSIEWWSPNHKTALLLSAGGGVGWLDSRGQEIEGAQGQDFNLTWYAMTGIEHRFGENWGVMAGAWYQHISNGGMAAPNPGIDAIGPMIGVTWSF